jgi:Cerato-platanin
MFYTVTLVLALFLTQATHALPQAPASGSPAHSWIPSSTPSASSLPPPTITARATFDTTFDNRAGSMNNVACSNGVNGLSSRFPTFGSLPSFPFIGGAFDVAFNSTNCGGCWSLTNPTTGTTINLIAIDSAGSGFNIAKEAFEKLTKGQIGAGAVDVVAHKVSPSVCGL